MLKSLCAAGLVPRLIVEEQSPFAARKADAYLRCLSIDEVPEPTAAIATRLDVPVVTVDNLNSTECLRNLSKFRLTMAVLGNTRIIKQQTLELLTNGCINVHPGLLPRIRGAFPQCWSIIQDEPVGCSCHLVDVGVDTGPILARKSVVVFEGDTLEEIVARTMYASAKILSETLLDFERMSARAVVQASEDGTTFHWPPPETIALAREKLRSGLYRYLAPRTSRT